MKHAMCSTFTNGNPSTMVQGQPKKKVYFCSVGILSERVLRYMTGSVPTSLPHEEGAISFGFQCDLGNERTLTVSIGIAAG